MKPDMPAFRPPTAAERVFNRTFGFLIGLGFGFRYNYLLQVRGRKTGRVYSTPVNMLEAGGKKYLVAPRGRAQWVRSAEAAGEVTLKKGSKRLKFRLRPVPDKDKPEILKAYLDQFKREVQGYFPCLPVRQSKFSVPLSRTIPLLNYFPFSGRKRRCGEKDAAYNA